MTRVALVPLLAALLAACSGGGGGDSPPPPPPPPPAAASLALLAGADGDRGNSVGSYETARFSEPVALGVDLGGNLYIADGNEIRKASGGFVTGVATGISGARGVAAILGGNVYFTDGRNVIGQIQPSGFVSILAGNPVAAPGFADGANALFNTPQGLERDRQGNVYVADTGNHVIRKITPAGLVTTIAGVPGQSGSNDGPALVARLCGPTAIATDDAGNLYIADSCNQAVRKLGVNGVVTTIGGKSGASAIVDGPAGESRFEDPRGITVDFDGNVYVSEFESHVIRRINTAGVTITIAGQTGMKGYADGAGNTARFSFPVGMAFDNTTGTILVADSMNHNVRRITRNGVVTTAMGGAPASGALDGTATSARFAGAPADLAVDASGNVLVADSANGAIRRVDATTGNVQTIAGVVGQGGSQDPTRLAGPQGIAVDAAGTIYVADRSDAFCTPIFVPFITCSRTALRKVTPAGMVTVAGSLTEPHGTTDGPGATARFRGLSDVAVDSAGNVFATDNLGRTIRRITPDGMVSTFAGGADQIGHVDGAGAQARFMGPQGIVIDRDGNLFVADGFTSIRKITPAGVVSTLAGTGDPSTQILDGTGAEARFSIVRRLAIDSNGVLYAADSNTVRRITPAGVVTTIAGVPSVSGFTPGPLPGIVSPISIAVEGTNLYLGVDAGVAVIRNRP